jgi:arylsulfatase A-like enzyme
LLAPLDGVSMVYSFADAKVPDGKHTQYFEIMGSRGIYHDAWMASAFGPKVPWRPDLTKLMNGTPDQDVWELYKIDDDFSQADDLAAKEPAKLAAMKELFTTTTKISLSPVTSAMHIKDTDPSG